LYAPVTLVFTYLPPPIATTLGVGKPDCVYVALERLFDLINVPRPFPEVYREFSVTRDHGLS